MTRNIESGMATNRVESLTDGVYAIAMTILILNLRVPAVPGHPRALLRALAGLQLQFFDFFISFFLLAIFWIIHHRQFHYFERADSNLLWINLFSLAFVVLIPFTTSLNGEYRNMTLSAVIFELNIAALGLLKYIQWTYATSNHRLVDPSLSQEVIENGKKLNLVNPLVAFLAIGVAFVAPNYSTMTFMLIPIIVGRLKKQNLKSV